MESDKTLLIRPALELPVLPAQRAEIRRLYYAEHWKIGTIAAQLGIHRETVRAAVERESLGVPPSVWRPSIIDPYLSFIRDILTQYPRLRATRIHEMLRQRGYAGDGVSTRETVSVETAAPSSSVIVTAAFVIDSPATVVVPDTDSVSLPSTTASLVGVSVKVPVALVEFAVSVAVTLNDVPDTVNPTVNVSSPSNSAPSVVETVRSLRAALLDLGDKHLHSHGRCDRLQGGESRCPALDEAPEQTDRNPDPFSERPQPFAVDLLTPDVSSDTTSPPSRCARWVRASAAVRVFRDRARGRIDGRHSAAAVFARAP